MGGLISFGLCAAVAWDHWNGDSWLLFAFTFTNAGLHGLAAILVAVHKHTPIDSPVTWAVTYGVTLLIACVFGLAPLF